MTFYTLGFGPAHQGIPDTLLRRTRSSLRRGPATSRCGLRARSRGHQNPRLWRWI